MMYKGVPATVLRVGGKDEWKLTSKRVEREKQRTQEARTVAPEPALAEDADPENSVRQAPPVYAET